MAVRFDNTADKLSRTASGLGTAFTVCGWFLLDTDRNTYSTFWSIDNAGSYTSLLTTTTGVNLYWATSGGGNDPSYMMTVGTWYFVGCTFTNTVALDTLYWAAEGAGSLSSQAADVGPGNDAWTFYIGGSGFAAEWLDGSAAHVKVWTAVLDAAEVLAEFNSSGPPVRTAQLWAYYPLADASDINDASGNTRHLTTAGTLTTATGPSLAPPPGPPMYLTPTRSTVVLA